MVEVNSENAAEVARTIKGGAVIGPSTVRRSPSVAHVASAMVKVQSVVDDPTKNKQADRGRGGTYRYADLPTVLDAVRPVLTAHGLAVMQFPCELSDAPALTTLVIHTSGEWIETTMRIRPGDNSPQSVGSALTYARRYALLSLCGVAADDDDDGKAASHNPRSQQQPAAKDPAPAPQAAEAVDAQAVARFAKHFAECETRADYDEVCELIVTEVQEAKLNGATRLAIRKTAAATLARVTGKQPA